MKLLVSACVLGANVRWNGANKESKELVEWAAANDVTLIPVCQENELFGTPRSTIKLVQIDGDLIADMKGKDVIQDLNDKARDIHSRYPDVDGFIGVYGSPSCGISVGVKNKGGMTKGSMHSQTSIPTTEVGHFNSEASRDAFLNRLRRENRAKI